MRARTRAERQSTQFDNQAKWDKRPRTYDTNGYGIGSHQRVSMAPIRDTCGPSTNKRRVETRHITIKQKCGRGAPWMRRVPGWGRRETRLDERSLDGRLPERAVYSNALDTTRQAPTHDQQALEITYNRNNKCKPPVKRQMVFYTVASAGRVRYSLWRCTYVYFHDELLTTVTKSSVCPRKRCSGSLF